MLRRLRHWWNQPAGGGEVFRLALPLMISSLSWTVMQFTDRMFLLWDSQQALAAALPSAIVWWVVICFPLGICSYANTFVAQYHGALRPERIGPAVWQGVWFALIATPLVLATIPLAPLIFRDVIGHTPAVALLEIEYYQILCWSAGFMLVGEALSAFFTGRGLTGTVMIVNAVAAGINVGLDYLWIFGHGGFPAMGIAGAAWATVVGQGAKALFFLILFLSQNSRRKFNTRRGWRIDRELAGRLIRFGAPNGLQLTLEVTGILVFICFVGRLGEAELVATNLAFNISSLAFMPVMGLGIAASTLVGQRLGENRDDLAARATWTTCALAIGYMSVVSMLYLLVPDLLLFGHLAHADLANATRLRDTAVVLLRFVAAYNLFDALGIVFVSAIKGAGDTRFVMLVTIVMASALGLGSWLAVGPLRLGLYSCWTLITVWISIIGLIYAVRFRQGHWRKMRVIETLPD